MRPRAIVLGCILTLSLAPASAQVTSRPAQSSLRDLLAGESVMHVAPSFDWSRSGPRRAALHARLLWHHEWGSNYETDAGLHMGSARWGLNTYGYSGIVTRVTASGNALTPWAEGTLAAGSGTGPSRVFQLSGGSGIGMIQLEVRSTWLGSTSASPRDSILGRVPASNVAAVDRQYTDAEATGSRAFGPIKAAITAGSRFGSNDGTTQWSFAALTLPLLSRFGFTLTGGTRPAQPERARRAGRFLQLSVAFDLKSDPDSTRPTRSVPQPAAGALQADAVENGYRLHLQARGARSVEMKGDLTDWEPVALGRDGDTWSTLVSVRAGVYKINLRIDGGAWNVPAGLVAVPDGFGGWTGILALN